MNIKELVSKLSLEEKAAMCSGLDFWHTKSVERLNIPSVMVSDGPHGLRKQADQSDHLGLNKSIDAVCFPAACATACTFDRKLMKYMGEVLGKECQAEEVSVLLGPAVNIKRSPLCGRNFEYISEDPYVAGELATSYINGVQSQNIGTSIKHFAANNQEHERMSGSSNVDERTLREIYFPAFEIAVKKSQPWTVMCSYNRLNGVFASENKWLLNDVLKEEWGFEGYVMSDWGAVSDRVAGINAGLELEMPGSNGVNDEAIIKAVEEGIIKEETLNNAVERILNIVFKYHNNKKEEVYDREKDHNIAVEIAKRCIVLLKNEEVLPLSKTSSKIAFIGEFADKPRYQGGGSSHINAHSVSGALLHARKLTDITYAKGFSCKEDKEEPVLFSEAVKAARESDIAVIFAGLPDAFESEGYDRTHMRLPKCQDKLIAEICRHQKNVIVVLHNGSPVEMPWVDDVSGIIEAYLGGEGIGEALTSVLFGDTNPSGKLAETFPIKMSDNPSYINFGGAGGQVDYKEGIFVGYRYYDTKNIDVLFPFGYGLSYTEFKYSNLHLSSSEVTDNLTIKVDITNIGKRAGTEVVQVYVKDLTNSAIRPQKELKGFETVTLETSETKTVTIELDKRAFEYFNEQISDWYAKDGEYVIAVGKSSRHIELCSKVHFVNDKELPVIIDKDTIIGDLISNPKTNEYTKEFILPYAAAFTADTGEELDDMMNAMLKYLPIRSLRSFGNITNEGIAKFVEQLNRQ